ncbi:uncharacterized protein LOC134266043 [Saccostrea cucullata]|uniref:uncharacterized protein LOC134266043 n=1 Tax=Saccostrea cuccullata TaxID=36930 RepID=UPI002ED4710E
MFIATAFTLLLTSVAFVSSKQLCFSCNGVPDEADCSTITTCSDSEACFVRKYTQLNGKPMFESGCLSRSSCKIIHVVSGIGKKRETGVTNCYECCESGNVTYPCNDNLCGKPIATETRCYSCSDTAQPENCENIIACDVDSMCYTGTYRHPLSHEIRYNMGCQRKDTCSALMNLWHSYQTSSHTSSHGTDTVTLNHCNDCCSGDFCNLGLCDIPKRVKPIFTSTPQNSTLRPEFEGVILVCRTQPSSNATMHWAFKGLSGGTTLSSQAHITTAPNNINVTIFPVHQSDLGEYICVATNSVGTSTTSAFLSSK